MIEGLEQATNGDGVRLYCWSTLVGPTHIGFFGNHSGGAIFYIFYFLDDCNQLSMQDCDP